MSNTKADRPELTAKRFRGNRGPAPISSSLKAALAGASVLAFCVEILGGFETNVRLWAKVDPAHVALAQSAFLTRGPRSVAELLLAVLLVPGLFAWRDQKGHGRVGIVAKLVGAAVLVGAFAGATGFAGVTGTDIAALHAVFGHIVFGCIAAATAFALIGPPDAVSSPNGRLAIGRGFPLRTLALWLPVIVITQVAMGAAYRHGQWSALPHIAGAMVAAFLLLAEGVLLLQKAGGHILLRWAARWAVYLVLLQVSLGVSDYVIRLLNFQDTVVWFALSWSHVVVGGMTLASSIFLAVSVRACVVNDILVDD